MKYIINGREFEVFIGERDYDYVDGKFEANDDTVLDEFIERIFSMRGQLFVNRSFDGDNTHYHGGDVPCYNVNGFRDSWRSEEGQTKFDVTKEKVKAELLKYDDAQAHFLPEKDCDEGIYYAGEDGHFTLRDIGDYLVGALFGWGC